MGWQKKHQQENMKNTSIIYIIPSNSKPYTSSLAEIVIWPRLLRFMDENGCRPVGEGRDNVYGEKIYLEQLL
jgi:hypothetical protein